MFHEILRAIAPTFHQAVFQDWYIRNRPPPQPMPMTPEMEAELRALAEARRRRWQSLPPSELPDAAPEAEGPRRIRQGRPAGDPP
jgi:hypothetical protein